MISDVEPEARSQHVAVVEVQQTMVMQGARLKDRYCRCTATYGRKHKATCQHNAFVEVQQTMVWDAKVEDSTAQLERYGNLWSRMQSSKPA